MLKKLESWQFCAGLIINSGFRSVLRILNLVFPLFNRWVSENVSCPFIVMKGPEVCVNRDIQHEKKCWTLVVTSLNFCTYDNKRGCYFRYLCDFLQIEFTDFQSRILLSFSPCCYRILVSFDILPRSFQGF